MNPRRYFILILATTLSIVAGAYGLAWWLQPLYGDLTRVGGHAERDFGWNEPIQEFHPLLSTFGDWTHPVDVLVLGDSFANLRPHQQWQNWLATRTGWRIHTLDKHLVDISELTASPLFKKYPPRVVIWNNIERDLKNEYSAQTEQCGKNAVVEVPPLKTHAADESALPQLITRPQALSELNPAFPRRWLLRAIEHSIGLESSETLNAKLVRSDLFSNRFSSNLLLFRKDFARASWEQKDLNRISCGYSELAKKFESNGVTRFVTALAPDKSSAYRPWLVDTESIPASHLPTILDKHLVPDARLDIALAKAIAAGTKDVYMPNDTHWGSAGHRLAAEAILTMLFAEGLVR